MRNACSRTGRLLLLFLFCGSHLPLAGCSGDSRTSGTVVEVSEEAKKHIESRRDAYKEKAKTRKDQSKVGKKR